MDEEQKEPQKTDNIKVEARLGDLLSAALKAYMLDRHLTNESEILRSAIGQMLEREGYILRVGEQPGEYKVVERPAQSSDPKQKKSGNGGGTGKIGFNKLTELLSQTLLGHDGDGEKDGHDGHSKNR